MNKKLKIGIIFLALLPSFAFASWSLEDSFESYTNLSDLDGDGGWSGSNGFIVNDVESYDGSQSIYSVSVSGSMDHNVTATDDGQLYFAMMRPNTAGDTGFNLRSGGSSWMQIYMEASNIELSGSPDLVTGYTTGAWYLFRVTIIDDSTVQVEVSDDGGSTWPYDSGPVASLTTGEVDLFRMGMGGGLSEGYFDYVAEGESTPEPVDDSEFASLLATADSSISSTTGFSALGVSSWMADHLLKPIIGTGIAIIDRLKWWIVAVAVIGMIIAFSRRGFRFYRT